MVWRNINKRLALKSVSIGFLLMGLFLLVCLQAEDVQENPVDQGETCKECLRVRTLEAMTIICFLAAFVLNLVGSFAKGSSKQSFRSSVKRMISSTQKRRGGEDGSLMTEGEP